MSVTVEHLVALQEDARRPLEEENEALKKQVADLTERIRHQGLYAAKLERRLYRGIRSLRQAEDDLSVALHALRDGRVSMAQQDLGLVLTHIHSLLSV